jgi:uncharacterized protein
MEYRRRIVEHELLDRIERGGAVVLEGPKATGKTATARQVCASEVLLDVDPGARATAAIDASLLLDGNQPRLIDEWQLEPAIWNHVRRAIDDARGDARFVLTGSAVPVDDEVRHTGAGRFSRLRMRTMSLSEIDASSKEISLASLLDGDPPRASKADLGIADLVDLACIGGWPGWFDAPRSDAMARAIDYLEQVRRTDIQRVDGVDRDPERVGRMLAALARNVATRTSIRTLARDAGGADDSLDEKTARDYVRALERLMIVEPQPSWAPHLRSRARVRSTDTMHLADPSLAVAALRATPDALLRDLNAFGFIFESLVVRDLRIYAQALDARVLQYRDNTGLEVDAIVECANGRWAAFEVKLGVGQVDDAAAGLLKFAERIDVERSGPPAALVVIVGTGYGYQRPDGVSVVPIGSLTT